MEDQKAADAAEDGSDENLQLAAKRAHSRLDLSMQRIVATGRMMRTHNVTEKLLTVLIMLELSGVDQQVIEDTTEAMASALIASQMMEDVNSAKRPVISDNVIEVVGLAGRG